MNKFTTNLSAKLRLRSLWRLVLFCPLLLSAPAFAQQPITVPLSYFSDSHLQSALRLTSYYSSQDNAILVPYRGININVHSSGIATMEGIDHLSSYLISLNCSSNKLTKLDLNGFYDLTSVEAGSQTLSLTMTTTDGTSYQATVPNGFNDGYIPTLPAGVAYDPSTRMLTSTEPSSTPQTISFSEPLGNNLKDSQGNDAALSGTITLTYQIPAPPTPAPAPQPQPTPAPPTDIYMYYSKEAGVAVHGTAMVKYPNDFDCFFTADKGYTLAKLKAYANEIPQKNLTVNATGDTARLHIHMPLYDMIIRTEGAQPLTDVTTATEVGTANTSLHASSMGAGFFVSGLIPGTMLSIYNILGQAVYQQEVTSTSEVLQAAALQQKGIYILVNGNHSTKVVAGR